MSYLTDAGDIAAQLRGFKGGRLEQCLRNVEWDDRVGETLKIRLQDLTDGYIQQAFAAGAGALNIDTSSIEQAILTAQSHL